MDLLLPNTLSVLVIGDAIIDEYVYVRVVGKAIKESALSTIITGREEFKGGVWAAAAHTRNFVKKVDVMRSMNVMRNSRMVEEVYFRKLFVTHESEVDYRTQTYDIKEYDVVIVCDFGHGTMTPELIERVTREAKFLCVNTQTNASNFGFNVIKKYPRADFVVLDEIEARLATHDNSSPIEEVIERLGIENIIVTLGKNGAIGWTGYGFHRSKAKTDKVIDTMGAGDAFLAVASPYAALGFGMKDLLNIGNAAGAAKVSIIGHRNSVNMNMLEEYLER